MASNLRVDSIVPATGSSVSIGTATGGVNIPGVLTYEDVTNVDSVGVITARSGIRIAAGSTVGPVSGIVTYFGDGSQLTGINTAFGSGTSINTSGIITATAFIPTTGQLSHRNIIISGAITVAQRMSSHSTGGQNLTGIKTADRFGLDFSGTDNTPTQIPGTVASGTTPYTLGFRKTYKITNGNQTSGAGTADRMTVEYKVEAQDMATCGWNYLSSSSYITLSYWVKSSVAQNFYGYIRTQDGTTQSYPYETGSLSANTWTKVTKTIPGNSNIQFDNNNDGGATLFFDLFDGTDYTGSVTLNQWGAYNASLRTPAHTSTWYTTNDATFEITGIQFEVGSQATAFEHRSYGEELDLCMRYFQQFVSGNNYQIGMGAYYASNQLKCIVGFIKEMRSTPSVIQATGTNNYVFYRDSAADTFDSFGVEATDERKTCLNSTDVSGTVGHGGIVRTYNADGRIDFSAEL